MLQRAPLMHIHKPNCCSSRAFQSRRAISAGLFVLPAGPSILRRRPIIIFEHGFLPSCVAPYFHSGVSFSVLCLPNGLWRAVAARTMGHLKQCNCFWKGAGDWGCRVDWEAQWLLIGSGGRFVWEVSLRASVCASRRQVGVLCGGQGEGC